MRTLREDLAFRLGGGPAEFDVDGSLAMERRPVPEFDDIVAYLDDFPYPRRLILGWWNSRPIHVVVADNTKEGIRIVITVYQPNLEQWEPGFRKRKKL